MMVFFGAIMFLSSCAQDIFVSYQGESENTGRIIIKPSAPTYSTYVTIGDSLIVDKKYIKSLTINNVPEGMYKIHYVSYFNGYNDKLDVILPVVMHDEREITNLVAVPPLSSGYWIHSGAFIIIPLVLLLLVGPQ